MVEGGKGVVTNGLSDGLHAVEITRKAIDLLSPPPTVTYDYVVHQGKRLLHALQDNVAKYEAQFGKIDVSGPLPPTLGMAH